MATSFVSKLKANAAADPHRAAVTCGDASLTRAELVERAGQAAARLAELGVTQSDTVTIVLPNSVDAVVTTIAAWWLGATPQPVSDRLPAAERDAIVELAQPKLVVDQPLDLNDSLVAPDDAIAPVWKSVTSGGRPGDRR